MLQVVGNQICWDDAKFSLQVLPQFVLVHLHFRYLVLEFLVLSIRAFKIEAIDLLLDIL